MIIFRFYGPLHEERPKCSVYYHLLLYRFLYSWYDRGIRWGVRPPATDSDGGFCWGFRPPATDSDGGVRPPATDWL